VASVYYHKGRLVGVLHGLGDVWMAGWGSDSGGRHRVTSPALAPCADRVEMQARLNAWAGKQGLHEGEAGTEEYADLIREQESDAERFGTGEAQPGSYRLDDVVYHIGERIEYQLSGMSEPRQGFIREFGTASFAVDNGCKDLQYVPHTAYLRKVERTEQENADDNTGSAPATGLPRPDSLGYDGGNPGAPAPQAATTAAAPETVTTAAVPVGASGDAAQDSMDAEPTNLDPPAADPTSPSLPPPAAGSPSLAADLEAVMALPLPESQAACEPRIRLSMRAARMLGSDAARCLAHALASYPEFKGSGGHARWRAWSLEKFGMATRTAEQYLAAGRVLLSLVHHGALNRRIASWDLHKTELLHSIPVDQVPALVEHGNLDDLTREELREKLRRLKLGKEDAAAPTETRPPRAPKPSMEIAAVIERLAELSGAEEERIGQASLTVEPLVAARAGAMCWELAARHAQRTGYVFSEEQISALRDLHGSIGAWLEGLGK